jgi:hypothetical protein
MDLPRPPSFAVGPEMSNSILSIISEHPSMSPVDIANMVNADPEHPFFMTDLSVARAWLAGDSIPSDRVDRLEREQWMNVQIAIALMAVDVASAELKHMEAALPIMRNYERNKLSSWHLSTAIQLSKILDVISEAGQIDTPIETVLRECLEIDPGVLSPDAMIGEDLMKKVISRPPTKDGSTRTNELPVDPDQEGKMRIEGEGEGSSDARTGSQRKTAKSHQGDEWGRTN